MFEGVSTRDVVDHDHSLRVFVVGRGDAPVLFLAGRVPESEVDRRYINHDTCGEVVEDGWIVLVRKSILRKCDKQACFTHTAITYDDTLDILHLGTPAVRSGVAAP